MKPETIERIKKLINTNICDIEARMMQSIQCNMRAQMEHYIAEYQKAYAASCDFEEWCDEQEKDDDTED